MNTRMQLFGFSFFFLCLLFLYALRAPAASDGPSRCYRITLPDSAATEVSPETRQEVWCYQKVTNPPEATYIYNADEGEVRPELSLIVENDGMLVHGSLAGGEITVHRVSSKAFNPFNIPLAEPSDAEALPENYAARLADSARANLTFLLSQPSSLTENFILEEGTVTVEATYQPWRGYWWPYKGLPMTTPLSKYDRFVTARTGSNPGSRSYEASRHTYKGIWWEGHCNGWAASAILRAEPKSAKTDSRTGITFTVSDIKGLLAERDYCAKAAFFGKRNRGGGPLNDIVPALFHKTITYYIGTLGKPVAVDYRNDSVVDNHIISGYTMNMERTGTNLYRVTVTARFHKYDGLRSNQPGTAPVYTRTYKYTLRTDASGAPIGGSWISTNPDFIWVPLSSGSSCKHNPRVQSNWVDEIRNL